MKKKNIYLIAGIIILIVALILISFFLNDISDYKIGGVFALSGEASFWGVEEMLGSQLAVDEFNAINNRNIKLIIEDSQSDAKGTLNSVVKLITINKVVAIVGPTWGDSFGNTIGDIVNENKILTITPSGALEAVNKKYDYYFSTYYPINQEMSKLSEFVILNNYKNVVILHDEDAFNLMMVNVFEKNISSNINVVDKIQITQNTTDFRTILAKINSLPIKPDILFVEIYNVSEMSNLLKNIIEMDLNVIILTTTSGQNEIILENYNDLFNNKYYFSYPNTDLSGYQDFEKKFLAKYGFKPNYSIASTAYDATKIILEGLKYNLEKEKLLEFIRTNIVPGASVNNVSFNLENQINSASFIIKTIDNNGFVIISD